jgi:hypothetical protein
MRCEKCFQDIPPGKEILDTKSEQSGAVGYEGATTTTVWVYICPGCAKKRDRFEIALWVMVIAIVIFGLLAAFGWL